MKFTASAILLAIALFSCSSKNNEEQKDKGNIQPFEADDPRVENAMKAAQDSLKYFVDYFDRYHGQENYAFSLKSVFADKGESEHMWSIPFSHNETEFRCVLDNEPNAITNYKSGDTITIRFVDVEDFIIVTADTTIIGNYLQTELENGN